LCEGDEEGMKCCEVSIRRRSSSMWCCMVGLVQSINCDDFKLCNIHSN
jgi:hypothetical protein